MGSFGIAIKAFRHGEGHVELERTDRDISIMTMLVGTIVTSVLGAGLLRHAWAGTGPRSSSGLLLMLVFSFFFTSVAANAIATTARNPVSGMTMLTIMISSVVLLKFGLSGPTGHVLRDGDRRHGLHGAVGLGPDRHRSQDRLLAPGRRPQVQERVKFLGVIAASVAVGLTIVDALAAVLLRRRPDGTAAREDPRGSAGLDHEGSVQSFMNREPVAVGPLRRRLDDRARPGDAQVPALTFALGMYLPLELNSPALVGGYLHHLVTKKAARQRGEPGKTLRERGVVIASGMMAGARREVLGVVIPAGPLQVRPRQGEDAARSTYDMVSQTISIIGFAGLVAYIWLGANRKPAD